MSGDGRTRSVEEGRTWARPKLSRERMEHTVRRLLEEMGQDPDRQGLLGTPRRVAESLAFLTKGYDEDPEEIVRAAVFEERYDEIVLVKDIDFYSLCEHHLLPFFGKAHVAYLPQNRILGLSKVVRLVEIFARRLQVQERMTVEIAGTLQTHLRPRGVAVVLEAQHLCMQMRGVAKQNSVAVTSSVLGIFRDCAETRAELMNLIGHHLQGS